MSTEINRHSAPEQNPSEPQEVIISPDTWDEFSWYVGSRETMNAEMLRLNSEGHGDLRHPDGSPINELEATAIVEALQAKGILSLDADENGFFSVVHDNKPKPANNPELKTAYDEIDAVRQRWRFLGKTATRVMGENKHHAKSMAREYLHDIPVNTATKIKDKSPVGRHIAATKQAREDARKDKLDEWSKTRQTKLILRAKSRVPAGEQLDDSESLEAQFDPAKMREFTYLNSEINNAIGDGIAKRKESSGRRILRQEEIDELTISMTGEIIREFLTKDGEAPSDDEVNRYGQLLTWFATNKLGPSTRRTR